MLNKESKLKLKKGSLGFTLVELLIVIAILGVLATVVLLVINPAEQFARTRDAARKSTMGQLLRSEQAYFTSHGGAYSGFGTAGNGWITQLVTAGELKQVPTGLTYSITTNNTACAAAASNKQQSNYCYVADGTTNDVLMYVTLESSSEQSKCATATNHPYFVWESATGTTCLECLAGAPTVSAGPGSCNPTQ